ncbi:MAG TPA: hypothetical protein VE224_04930, partial [Pseudolabrys sp.]|nr:hypothetical protein [Pseudolabrys sp.]
DSRGSPTDKARRARRSAVLNIPSGLPPSSAGWSGTHSDSPDPAAPHARSHRSPLPQYCWKTLNTLNNSLHLRMVLRLPMRS